MSSPAQIMASPSLGDMTVGEALAMAASARPDAPYITAGSAELSFAELWQSSGRLATGLVELGLRKGDHVTTAVTNRIEWVVIAFALARLGVVNVLANPRYRAGELAYLVAHSRSRFVISDRALDTDFDSALTHELMVLGGSGSASGVDRLQVESAHGRPDPRWKALLETPVDTSAIASVAGTLNADDVLYILYTSGTTGRPKGSMTRHGAALLNAFNSGERMGFDSGDRLLCYLTMTHCFGAVNALLNTLTHQCRLDILNEFDPGVVLDLIEERQITAIYGVPTHFTMLCDAAAQGPARDLHTLVKGCCGGGEITPELQAAIAAHLGIESLTHAYGMSESTAIISQSLHSWPRERRLGTAGLPLPGVEVRITDPETGMECPTGSAGEIAIRGFNVHAGYFMLDPDPSLREDGWWETGDIGVRGPDGAITIRGRSKDMYKTGGFNVYPVEVETCLARHPAVGDVAVVGVPDRRKQEVGAAFVVPVPETTVDPEELRALARSELVGYKVPEYVFLVEELPRSSATLKVQKHVLRERARSLLETAHSAASARIGSS
ncbi:acyl--CoA ligase [Mycolicibacterium pulveris]|uniref:AMP-binding protein n=1 Tax=Mycolicibacterium pulveris TaxID=36813 RepID=A0A7I7UNK6_MYCPV|nr:class I adenylate-forming enzyme family protein [Mycolicibacterium pulveris]MCV6983194.1 acyl--CoA ligase [Mycolicibacterium pulveris]BBY83064.1 AMP-binding protein [Mycolicibacterium pulveris]